MPVRGNASRLERVKPGELAVLERLALELEILNRRAEYERGMVGAWQSSSQEEISAELERRRLVLEAAIARRKP